MAMRADPPVGAGVPNVSGRLSAVRRSRVPSRYFATGVNSRSW